jgi:hypothetical protein
MSLTHLIKQLHFWRLSGLLAADLLVFGTTDPQNAPSFMLIIGFVLMSVTVYYLLDGLLAFTRLYGFPARHRKRVLKTLALLSCGLLGLQSIGQLGARDVLILAPLTLLAYFYVAYSKSSKQSA